MKTILFVVNDLKFFLSHRKDIGLSAIKQGYKFVICAPISQTKENLEEMGFEFIALDFKRKNKNPFKELIILFSLARIINKLEPDILHLVTIKPIIYGGILSRLFGNKPSLIAFPGLGFLHTNKLLKKLLRPFLKTAYKYIFNNPNQKIIFHNKTDSEEMMNLVDIEKDKINFTYGSGVDLEEFKFSKIRKSGPIVFLFASRFLKDKGIEELYAAAEYLSKDNNNFDFRLIGSVDPGNPSSISSSTLKKWKESGCVAILPFKEDIYEEIKNCHVAVLPSYREGMPKFLLEAASVGRAIITTNAPGCDECVKEGHNGYKIPIKDYKLLAMAIKEIGSDLERLETMGENSRAFAEKHYSLEAVINKHLEIYNKL